MSTHPNAMILLILKPDDLSRKTLRAIRQEAGVDLEDGDIEIGEDSYHIDVMESTYDEDKQISADEGDIVVWDLVTYGYGERIEWDKLATQKAALDVWASGVCERHKCVASIFVSANYW